MELYALNLLHLLAAMVWVGGSISVALVITPVLRRKAPHDQRIPLIAAMGTRFRTIGWIALVVLVLTGARRALLAVGGTPDPWAALTGTAYGRTLSIKIFVVAVLLLLQLVHDFVLGPRVQRLAAAADPGLARARAATIGLAMGGLLLSLVVVGLAASLRFR
jgi:putative copper resistance protein D